MQVFLKYLVAAVYSKLYYNRVNSQYIGDYFERRNNPHLEF